MKKILLLVLFVLLVNPCFSSNIISKEEMLQLHNYMDILIGKGRYITTDFLFEKFCENQIKFKNDFKNKPLRIGGIISQIREGMFNSYIISLHVDGSRYDTDISLPDSLSQKSKEKLMLLKTGEQIYCNVTVGDNYTTTCAVCYKNDKGEAELVFCDEDLPNIELIEKNTEKDTTLEGKSVEDGLVGYISAKSGINLRTSSTTSSQKIVKLPYNTEIVILDINGPKETIEGITSKWYMITDGNVIGWCFGGFIKLK